MLTSATRLTTLELSPRPQWYDQKTSTGKPMTRVGTLQGTYLGVYPAKVCEYWTEKPQKTNCKFCSVGLNLGVDDADEKSVNEVMEVVRAAREESGHHLRRLQHRPLRGRHLPDILEPYIRRIKKESGSWSASRRRRTRTSSATTRCARWASTASPSASRSSTPAFQGGLPGQGPPVRPRALPRRRRVLRRARQEGPRNEPWVTNGEIIVGLEPPGVVDPGDRLDHVGRRDPDGVRLPAARRDGLRRHAAAADGAADPRFERLYEACMEQGLPIGWPRTST